MKEHYWQKDKFIDGRIYDPFEQAGYIYVIGNKFINDEYGCKLSKIGYSAQPLQALKRWRKNVDRNEGWFIYGAYGLVNAYADHRIHYYLQQIGIERFEDPYLGQEWFRIPGRDAASVVRFYLAARKKYSLRVWVPKEFR